MEREQIDCKILEGGVKRRKKNLRRYKIKGAKKGKRSALPQQNAKEKKQFHTALLSAGENWLPNSGDPHQHRHGVFFVSRFHTCGAIKHAGFGFIQMATRHASEWISCQSKEKLQLSPPSQKILFDFTQRAFPRLQTLFLQIHKYS